MAIRPLSPSDIDALFAIEQAATVYPWSRRQFADGLAAGEFGWGIECESRLAGFALFNQVLDEATLLDIAVHPDFQRRGLAWELLRFALRELDIATPTRCLLEVRETNASAIALYKKAGFIEDGIRRNYYPTTSGRENALLMSRPVSAGRG